MPARIPLIAFILTTVCSMTCKDFTHSWSSRYRAACWSWLHTKTVVRKTMVPSSNVTINSHMLEEFITSPVSYSSISWSFNQGCCCILTSKQVSFTPSMRPSNIPACLIGSRACIHGLKTSRKRVEKVAHCPPQYNSSHTNLKRSLSYLQH